MLLLLCALLATTGIAAGAAILGEHDNKVCESPICLKAAAHLLKTLDPSVSPCKDFYQFACGKMSNSTKEPKEGSRLERELRAILEDKSNAKEPKAFSQVRRLYALCLDEATIDSRGLDPLLDLLRSLGKWPILEEDWSEEDWDLWDVEIKLSKYALGGSLFTVKYYESYQNASQYQIWITDSNTGDFSMEKILSIFPMPKDEPDDKSVEGFNETLANLFEKAGVDRKKIMKSFEDANSFKTALTELRDFELEKEINSTSEEHDKKSEKEILLSHQYSLPRLQESIPWIDWTKLLQGIMPQSVPLKQDELLFVAIDSTLLELKGLIDSTPKQVVANYMMWHAIQKIRPHLPSALTKRPADKEVKERWQQCINVVTRSGLSLALASMLARNYGPLSETATTIAINLQTELVNSLKETAWLDEKTRKRAENKISTMELIMGFNAEVADTKNIEMLYKKFTMNTKNYFEAMLDSRKWENEFSWARLRLPVKMLDWRYFVWPYFTINAFNVPFANTVEVTGPIMKHLTIFDGNLPSYLNYGSLGTIIGHELFHSLDNTGIQVNETGGKEDWFSDISMSQFTDKTRCLIKQYSAFNETKVTQLTVDGENTQGENIADNGGVKLAYHTYRKVSKQLISPEPKLPGLEQYTRDQLFMLSAVNFFCAVTDKDELERQIKYDEHAPNEFRVKGEMMNFDVFSRVFDCAKGDPMNPINKCEVW